MVISLKDAFNGKIKMYTSILNFVKSGHTTLKSEAFKQALSIKFQTGMGWLNNSLIIHVRDFGDFER